MELYLIIENFNILGGMYIGIYRFICLVIIELVFIGLSFSQPGSTNFHQLSTLNGLSGSSVTDIVQDSDGFIWIATNDGLNKYDGNTLKTYRNIIGDSTSLCDNKINDLFIDSKGRIWIGTENNGVNVYLPEHDNFKHYPYDQANNRTLSFRYITSIKEDKNNTIWVTTLKGLNTFNEEYDWFDRIYRNAWFAIYNEGVSFLEEQKVPEAIVTKIRPIISQRFNNQDAFKDAIKNRLEVSDFEKYYYLIEKAAFSDIDSINTFEQIRAIDFDENGNLWLGLERKGISFYNVYNKCFTNFFHLSTAKLTGIEIRKLQVFDKQLWLCSETGLSVFSLLPDTISFEAKLDPPNSINSLLVLNSREALIGSNKGLMLVTVKPEKRLVEISNRDKNLDDNIEVTTIFKDKQNLIWLGTNKLGVLYKQADWGIKHFSRNSTKQLQLTDNNISNIFFEEDFALISYESGYNELWNAKRGLYQNNITNWLNYRLSKNGLVQKVLRDRIGNLWIGTEKGGLFHYNRVEKTIKPYSLTSISTAYKHNIIDIDQDKNGDIWLCLFGGGLVRINPDSDKILHIPGNYTDWEHSLANDWVHCLYTDSLGYIMVGSVDGLSVAHVDTLAFTTYSPLTVGDNKPSHASIHYITGHKLGDYWLASENGLNNFNVLTRKFTIIGGNNQLPNNHILAVISWSENEIWISTKAGISKLILNDKLQLEKLKSYDLSFNKFQKDWLKVGISGTTQNNELYFGGEEGFILFKPADLQENTEPPGIKITEISILNNVLKPKEWKSGNTDKYLKIKYFEDVISISYSAINYIEADKNQYAYKMEGFDKDWQMVGNKRYATYTNLPAGEYTFKVKAANNDAYWTENYDSIAFVISPPIWETTGAYAVYFIILFFIAFGIVRFFVVRNLLRTKVKIKEAEVKRDNENNALKLRFFTNISHEFKTPLTLMFGPIEKLINNGEGLNISDRSFYYNLIQTNAHKLLKLIDQLMDFRKLENKSFRIEKKHGDIIEVLHSIYNQFIHEAKQRNIAYNFKSELNHLYTDFDAGVIDKITVNLISNALKYTAEGGFVNVNIRTEERYDAEENQQLIIEVEDNGYGIPNNMQNEIFTRFYQIKHKESIGSGIGLAFTKDLIKLLNGEISLKSKVNVGSVFKVVLPLELFADSEITNNPQPESLEINIQGIENGGDQYSNTTILLVDDTPDILEFLEKELSSTFTILKAKNGKEGLDLALKHIPDMIISDVMMPIMDGVELCKRLKSDRLTSHIPIILLTAKSSEQSVIEGLEQGADAYIKKPFSSHVLKVKIGNLLEYRNKLKSRFLSDLNLSSETITDNSLDKEFLDKATNIVLNNLINTNLSADFLTQELAVSKTQLYSKLKSLTGQSINEFIRIIRLKKAMLMMQEGHSNLSNLAYDVGFSSLSYFTRSFIKHFGKAPSEFTK